MRIRRFCIAVPEAASIVGAQIEKQTQTAIGAGTAAQAVVRHDYWGIGPKQGNRGTLQGGIGAADGYNRQTVSQPGRRKSYVTTKALDGVYLTIAEQESAIRQNPMGASSDIVRKVWRDSVLSQWFIRLRCN